YSNKGAENILALPWIDLAQALYITQGGWDVSYKNILGTILDRFICEVLRMWNFVAQHIEKMFYLGKLEQFGYWANKTIICGRLGRYYFSVG
ncbi:hypothetical protein ACJX0J_020870, partial [Zea mays]